MKKLIIVLTTVTVFACTNKTEVNNQAAKDVLNRTIGVENADKFILEYVEDETPTEWYLVKNTGNKILIESNSQVALCHGAYDYLKNSCNSLISWSGARINIPEVPVSIEKRVESPYQFRYYFNVVTHGYSTTYWDWERWEKEIDWMAIHGINMPLIGGAHEAILYRVFQELGLTDEEIDQYFSGPAHFPWNRMGNLNGWDGPMPKSYYQKQIDLTHKMLDRMRDLEMSPIIHAFAGFIPEAITRVYPDVEIRELGWGGGLDEKYNAYILSPTSELFTKIGSMYIQEWEKEFGKGEYYLADSFNEMDVPLPDNQDEALDELAGYGEKAFLSIAEANPDATWVMQGWTFPFHRDENGDLFWTPERLGALVSKIPDDKLLILDLANEYNHSFWKIDPSWKMYEGFFGKKWIYSFIPNMGGKVPLNGILDVYANIPIDALNYENKKNLVGFGFAPEGIENNEVIYELLSDMAWTNQAIDLDSWLEKYCIQRYGAFPQKMKESWDLLNQSCLGTFTDHPMHRYQLRPCDRPNGVERRATVHRSAEFNKAVGLFLECNDELGDNELYVYDAIELVVQYLGNKADEKLMTFLETKEKQKMEDALEILEIIDKLLASHPNHNLKQWVDFARKWGDTDTEKDYYESNAKRLLTTWGGVYVNDYAGKVWSGLIRDYYIPRWKAYHLESSEDTLEYIRNWELEWALKQGVSEIESYENPVSVMIDLYDLF